MKKLVITLIQYLIFLALGFGLLWLVFRKVDLHQLVAEIHTLNYFWLAIAFVVGILSHIARALRWNLLIQALGYRTNNVRTFYAVMIGYLANLAIPRIGEVTRCGVLAKSEDIPVNSLIGTVISERIWDMVVLLFMTVFVVLFKLDLVGGFVAHYLLIPLKSKAATNPAFIFYLVAGTFALIALLILAYHYVRPKFRHLKFYQKFKALILGFWDGILSIVKLRKKGRFLILTLALWGCYFLMTYLSFSSMKVTSGLGWEAGLIILTLGSFGMVAPVPGGIGAYHFIVKAILVELYAIAPVQAASFATVVHFIQIIVLILIGALSYGLFFLFMKKKANAKAT